MPRKNRALYNGAIYHVFDRGVAKQPIFLDDRDREKFLEIIEEIYIAYNFILHAFCLMGNHFHLLIETFEPNLPEIMHRLMCKYAKYFNTKYERPGYLFQDRYDDRNVETEGYFAILFRYFALNPVERRDDLVAQDCFWSSYHDYFYGKQRYEFLNRDLVDLLFQKYQMNLEQVECFLACPKELLQDRYHFDDCDFEIKKLMPIPRLISNEERKIVIIRFVNNLLLSVQQRKYLLVFLLKRYTRYSDRDIGNFTGYKSTSSISRIYNQKKLDYAGKEFLRDLESALY